MIKVNLDENLCRTAVKVLHQAEYEAERLYEEWLSGLSDKQVWNFVCDKERFFIMLDLDFSDARVIKEYPLDALKGCFAVADEHRTRLRRPSV